MVKRRVGYFVIGICCVAFGVEALMSGTTYGLGNLAGPRRYISFDSNPVEYLIVLFFWWGFGVACIWAAFTEK